MGNLTACIAKMGKSLNDTDRRDIMERYGAHMKDGMPASDAAELAIREVHGELVNELNDIIKSASQVGVRISMSEPIVAKTDTVAKTADQSEEARLASLSPFEFAAEVLQVLGSAQDVYRAPKIPKTVTTVDAAVAIGIPGATKTGFKSEEDFTAGFNTPEANTSDNAFDVAEQVRYGETTFALPANPRTGNPGGEFKVKIYEPSKNFPSGAIEVDVSLVGSGNSGAVVYNMAAGLAAATGRSFRADSASMSEWGALRRTVSMTNAAMRYGVQFVEPGEPQMRPGSKVASVGVAPLDWEPRGLGKTVGNNEGAEPRAAANFGNLLRSEARSVPSA